MPSRGAPMSQHIQRFFVGEGDDGFRALLASPLATRARFRSALPRAPLHALYASHRLQPPIRPIAVCTR
ncbi:hypothetical protein NDU88_003640 [Pleurodeles waltl]|uniref:Uncharacterized protein n=1 Tax=Pleurodeles waltl TaxID=8319 RepID=A0AAV7T750_PLEWA|nr:hypothetical protein NDU88_003640 [Pleurodeles waltl]